MEREIILFTAQPDVFSLIDSFLEGTWKNYKELFDKQCLEIVKFYHFLLIVIPCIFSKLVLTRCK